MSKKDAAKKVARRSQGKVTAAAARNATNSGLAASQVMTLPDRKRTCFVIMAIGDQDFGETKVSASDLRNRYSDLIREAICAARADIEVTRADEVMRGGGITNDIFERLMKSDYVVADLSFPNPNVYYELGLRHACRSGTISIRDKKSGFRPPFDVAPARHFEYENTPTGVKQLKSALEQAFAWIDANSSTPDNMFLEYAQFTKFEFPRYGRDTHSDVADAFAEILQYPELLEALTNLGGKPMDQKTMLALMAKYPAVAKTIIKLMLGSGKLKLPF